MKGIVSILVLVACTIVVGCTTTAASVARGYETQIKAGIMATDDNNVQYVKDAMCFLPYGAVYRHPEIVGAVKSVCGALADVPVSAAPAPLNPASAAK